MSDYLVSDGYESELCGGRCEDGFFQEEIGTMLCKPCPIGYYCSNSTLDMTPCDDENYYCPNEGMKKPLPV